MWGNLGHQNVFPWLCIIFKSRSTSISGLQGPKPHDGLQGPKYDGLHRPKYDGLQGPPLNTKRR